MNKRILFLFTFIFIFQSVFSQITLPKFDFTTLRDLNVAYLKMGNFASLADGQKKGESISYEDVKGSPFWEDDWNSAIFVLANGNIAKAKKAKLNLFSNEIHFVSPDKIELSCEHSQIKKIYFFKGSDTSKVIAVFESLADPTSNSNVYYQILNEGRLRLLKQMKVLVKENDYDPSVGKKEFSFYNKSNYAIADNEKVISIKSLSQSSVFTSVPKTFEYMEWLKQNNNKLKNEFEINSFFTYFNSKEQK